ncbi:AfsR/SARP family transcriptional regulator [Actinoplanes sp. URMC 104]|uniref:AfsR/SARP family transcriptional regulator n=1 Tax=Actinoplanes sp. URMC 104 TaxID=3423409 RepID=UPI003F1CBDED
MLVRMLGPFEVSGDHGPVEVHGGSQRTVLALLALHAGRPVSVATLMDALWPDGPPASARNSLQSHVARLRAALGGASGLVALGPASYCLSVARADVDVLRFEDLLRDGQVEAALRLWRGAPLPEFEGEPFRGMAERLAGLHRDALARWVRALLESPPGAGVRLENPPGGDGVLLESPPGGDGVRMESPHGTGVRMQSPGEAEPAARGGGNEFERAVDELREAAVADPCWERGAEVLAKALARSGQRGEALEALRRHADAVVERLGIDPSESVRLLQVELLRGEPARAGQAAAGGRRVPLRFSSFLGRDAEQRRLAEMVAQRGLVTVTGPGGVGKTRLVAETVRAGARVAWVDAADVAAEDFVAAVAVGVGARVGPLDDALAMIARQARAYSVVVLDNCEHVLEPAAAVVEAMRGVRVVVTSQERLRTDGERVLDLGPLPPADAARLFRERAQVPADPADVAEIVRRLDRLPLAIELAATQASALGVAELRERLDDRLDLLDRGRRTGSARHRTLRAVVAWSFSLLEPRARTVLCRLSAFAGAFTVAQAEAVVADEAVAQAEAVVADGAAAQAEAVVADGAAAQAEAVVADGAAGQAEAVVAGQAVVGDGDGVVPRRAVAAELAGLVDRSLVARHGPGRFRLLETVRAYAARQPADDRAALFRRHGETMLAAARRLDRELRGPAQAAAVRELDELLPDLRLAAARVGPGLREQLAAALYRYGYRCQQYEVLAWGRHATRNPDALAAAATHAWGRGDLAEARSLAAAADPPSDPVHEVLGDVALVSCDPDTALAHYRAMGDEPVHRVSGLTGEALVCAYAGRTAQAVAAAESAVELAGAIGNPSARAEALYGLGEALGDTDPDRALDLLTEAAKLAASVDDRLFLGAAETAAVAIRSRHGDPAAALAAFRDVLTLWRRVGNDTLRTAALRNLVVLLVRVGADETAVLVDAALPVADVYPAERARLDRARSAAAERLGAGPVAALRRRGALLSPAQVHDEASRAIDAALSRLAG